MKKALTLSVLFLAVSSAWAGKPVGIPRPDGKPVSLVAEMPMQQRLNALMELQQTMEYLKSRGGKEKFGTRLPSFGLRTGMDWTKVEISAESLRARTGPVCIHEINFGGRLASARFAKLDVKLQQGKDLWIKAVVRPLKYSLFHRCPGSPSFLADAFVDSVTVSKGVSKILPVGTVYKNFAAGFIRQAVMFTLNRPG